MKQRFTFLLAALLLLTTPLLSLGQSRVVASIDFSQQGYENAQDMNGVVIAIDANVSVVFDQADGNYGPKYYNSGTSIRAYGGNTITFTASSGSISSIVITQGPGGNANNPITPNVGTFEDLTWSGAASEVILSIGGTSGHRRVMAVEVTYTADANTVAAPVFTPGTSTIYGSSVTVTASSMTSGATIRYTTDGSEPTSSSTLFPAAGVTFTQTTTLKAKAFKTGMTASSVTTATYTFPQMYPNIAAWKAAHPETNSTVSGISGEVTAVFQNGQTLYVQDATGGLLVYGNLTNTYENGDVITGGLYGTSSLYNGLIEFIPTQQPAAGTSGTAVAPVVVTAEQISTNFSAYESRLVKIEEVTFLENHTFNIANAAGRTTQFTQNGVTLTCFDSFKVLADYEVTEGEVADIIGFVGCYNATQQIFPRSTDDIIPQSAPQPVVANPTFNPVAGSYVGSVEVAISCATPGASIYYTTNGTTPTVNSTLYSEPIVLSQTTTLKAFAVKAEYQNSEVVTADYTITIPVSTTFNKVMNPVDLNTTSNYLLVCESAATAATGVVLNSALQTSTITISAADHSITTAINATGYPYTVMLEATEGGYFLKINGSYLNNASSTGLALGETGASVWAANPFEGGYILQNLSNNDRFIGGSSAAGSTYKAYAINNLGTEAYPVVVLFKEGETSPMQQVATPTITPNGGFYTLSQEVTLACATEGATIHYTLDDTEPTVSSAVYSAPFTVSATTNVKAMAVKEGMSNSAVASASFTFPTLMTIADARALNNNQYAYVEGVVTFKDGRNIYIQDATAGIDLYLNNNTVPSDLALGDKVRAYGKKTTYNGLIELTGINGGDQNVFRVVSTGNTLPLAYKTVAECLAGADGSLQSTRVMVQDAIIGAIHTNGNTTLVQGNDTINIYKIPALTGIEENSHVNVTAVIGYFNAPQLRVANATDVVLLNANLSVTPTLLQGFTYEQGQGPSAAQTFAINGQYLESYVTVTAAQYFELCTTANGTYSTSLTLPTNNGVLDGATVYVRLMAGLTMNTYNSTVTVSSGQDNASLAVVGSVTIENAVATPTFSPVAGSYMTAQNVVISCATADAEIHYTVDGTEPTEASPVYTEPILVNNTMTIKAMGVKINWLNSLVASATYEIHEPITIVEARQLANNQYAAVEGVVTHIDNRNIYVQDATAAIVLYLNNNTVPSDLAVGDLVRSYGKKSVYNGLVELTGINGGNESEFVILSSGHNLPLANKTIAQILEDYNGDNLLQSTRVKIQHAIIGTINNNGNTPITQNNNEMNIYKLPVVEGLIAGDYVTVIGVVGCYNAAQLLVGSATDVQFTHRPTMAVNPSSLSGFTYEYGNGPSAEQSFEVSGERLESMILVRASDHFEISTGQGSSFVPSPGIVFFPTNGIVETTTVYVRLKSGLQSGNYTNEAITLTSDNASDVSVVCSGTVTGEVGPTSDWRKISSLDEIAEGNQIIIAARYDNENTNSYYAMTASTSGKPEGVLCTTSMVGDDEVLSEEITNNSDTYAWTIGRIGDDFTFTNASGQVLGYVSSTNFATGGDNIAWSIVAGTSIDTGVMVSNYSAFNIINVNVPNRAAALNSNHNFGPYSTSNMTNGNGANYNFYLDIFVGGNGGTPTVSVPTFDPEGGTYYEAQEVSLTCGTEGATIFYSLDSESGPWTEYTEPIAVSEDLTIWAYAEKEGYNNSMVVNAEYIIVEGIVILFEQDWEGDWNGWTEVSVLGEPQWTIGSYSGNHYAYANAYQQGATEDWLISPAFDLNAHPDAILNFVTAKNYNGPDLEVYFSNDYDGQDPTNATWQLIECPISGGSWNWVASGDLNLSAYSGSNCYIGFKYTSTDDQAAGWEVDDIILYAGGVAPTDPYLIATPNSLSGFVSFDGQGPSEPQTFVLEGGNLLPLPGGGGVVTLALGDLIPTYFEMSLDGETYVSNYLTIELDETMTLEPTTIYVRMNAPEIGTYNATIIIENTIDVYTEVTLSGEVLSNDQPTIDAFMPMYIQGNNGSNNSRVPVAIAVYLMDLEPNSTYRYVNQLVDDNDGPETPGAGNVIYTDVNGFYRSTSPSLSAEGGYGEFTTDEYGEAFVWFMNEPTANTRFTPGNHVYLRIRINDGNEGTEVAHIFTTEDYATVLNFGTEYGENQGSAFYVKSEESPMNFVMLFSTYDDWRPTYSTSIETTGVDYANINQYASFYKEEVAGKDGYFGGIIPNDNPDGINIIWVLDMESYVVADYYTNDGLWGVTSTANPNIGLDTPLFIDLIGLSVEEVENMNVHIWSFGKEITIENNELEGFEMTMFNILGQPMMTKNIAAASHVSFSHNLSDGLYIIKLQNNDKKVSTKIVVR